MFGRSINSHGEVVGRIMPLDVVPEHKEDIEVRLDDFVQSLHRALADAPEEWRPSAMLCIKVRERSYERLHISVRVRRPATTEEILQQEEEIELEARERAEYERLDMKYGPRSRHGGHGRAAALPEVC